MHIEVRGDLGVDLLQELLELDRAMPAVQLQITEEARRDQAVREQLLTRFEEAIAETDRLSAAERQQLYGQQCAKLGYKRLIRTTKTGLLRIDRAAVKAEEHLDGKFLLRSSDPTLSVEDIALGYKQLLQIERA